jgi:hypothetical protein
VDDPHVLALIEQIFDQIGPERQLAPDPNSAGLKPRQGIDALRFRSASALAASRRTVLQP